jgi:hypothetical protein
MTTLDFDVDYAYDATADRILIPLQILHAGTTELNRIGGTAA